MLYLDCSTQMATSSSSKTTISGRFLDADKEHLILSLPLEGYAKKLLISLKEAVVPLAHIFHGVETRVWIAVERSQSSSDGLEQNEGVGVGVLVGV